MDESKQSSIGPVGLQPNYAYWARCPYWTPEEFAALSLNICPEWYSHYRDHIFRNIFISPENAQVGGWIDSHLLLIDRAREFKQLPHKIPPSEGLLWLNEKQLPVAFELEKLVRELSKATNWKQKSQANEQTILELRSQLHFAENQLAEINKSKDRVAGSDPAIDPRTYTSLAKLIHGMAAHKFGYDPSDNRSDTVSKIRNSLELTGLQLGEKTVRSTLRDAYKHLCEKGEIKRH